MAQSQQVPVKEQRRQIVFDTGERLDLHNVTAFDPSGQWLRIWSDEGLSILNPERILFHTVKAQRTDEQ
jgi:hypothetical protein